MADAYAGRRVLITGGLGFIGSNLAIALVERGAEVTLVDAMLPAYGAQLFNVEPVRQRVRINFSDVRDSVGLRHLVRDQHFVFNLAGQASHLRSMDDPLTDLTINCQSQLSLLACCRAVNPDVRLILASTRQVYGRPERLPVDETHPTVPVDINGVHKLAAESYYRLYHELYGLRVAILRLTNTYGPRMDVRSADKGFVGVFLRRALTGETVLVYGDGTQRRDFNHVDDVVDALLRIGTCDAAIGHVFNLGDPRPRSLDEFARLLQRLTDCRYERVPFPPDQLAIDIGDYWGDFRKLQSVTGWEPHIDLEVGLGATVAYLRRHADKYLPASV
jgi:UDP-glucose 4-epimerase